MFGSAGGKLFSISDGAARLLLGIHQGGDIRHSIDHLNGSKVTLLKTSCITVVI